MKVSAAAPSVLGSGLMHLAFLSGLTHLSLALDLPPACPEVVRDFPTALRSLSLANAWLAEMPRQLHDLTGGFGCGVGLGGVGGRLGSQIAIAIDNALLCS